MGLRESLLDVTNDKIMLNEPMKKHTTLGVGGNAEYYYIPKTFQELNDVLDVLNTFNFPYKVIGCGSNLLVSDSGYKGVILDLKNFKDIIVTPQGIIAMSGARLSQVIEYCATRNLGGIESLSGIPASVGGAVVMNAGAFEHNISDFIQSVKTYKDGKTNIYNKNECLFDYRKSKFLGENEIIISATFNLVNLDKEIIYHNIKTYKEYRLSHHPTGRTCGSVFKNIKNVKAWQLIEGANLMGCRIGGVSVSEKHANFIINDNNASALDVYLLINYIKEKVYKQFNYMLKEEVEYLGEFK